ncbi:MAG: hypothetical protein JO071_03635, partial [Deltaproteobacteria bacterium]|nr:hypothetical protein [Deltaproteobacteria bacterium]
DSAGIADFNIVAAGSEVEACIKAQADVVVASGVIDEGLESAGGIGAAGGYQGIMVVADPAGSNSFYRAGSNFREDGDSIGW